MTIFIALIACLFAFCSIFAAFGPAYVASISGTSIINPTMFDVMLGNSEGNGRHPALTWLFCCELIIMIGVIAAIVLYFLAKKEKDKSNIVFISSAALGALSLAGSITSFSTMSILGAESGSSSIWGITASSKMGAGAIITGIMLLIAFLGFAACIVLKFVKKGKK